MVSLLSELPEPFATALAKTFSAIIIRYNFNIDESKVEIHEGIAQINTIAGIEA